MLKNLVAVLVALSFVFSAEASDHTDNPGEVLDPSTDLTDLFAFVTTDPTLGDRVNLVLNTFLSAGPGARFSDVVSYDIRFFPADRDGMPLDSGYRLSCQFDGGLPQRHRCELTNGAGEVLARNEGKTGKVQSSGALRIFTGRRLDPFFLDDSKVKLRRNPKADDDFSGTNITAYDDVLAIVADFDRSILGTQHTQFGVFAEVRWNREDSRPILDRVGRPEITNITMRVDRVKYIWNHEETLALGPQKETYLETIRNGVLGLDQADGVADFDDDSIEPLVDLLVRDYLLIDFSRSSPVGTHRFFEHELSRWTGKAPSAGGGRGLDDDIVDTLLTLYISGPNGRHRGDGVNAPARPAASRFPFLHAPHLADAPEGAGAARQTCSTDAPQEGTPPTTNPAIFVANTEARLASFRAQLENTGPNELACALIANDLRVRGQYTEQGKDFVEALSTLDACVAAGVDGPTIYLLRAISKMALHKLDAARQDLGVARERGLDEGKHAFALQAILWAQGDRATAKQIVRGAVQAKPSFTTYSRLGVMHYEEGNIDEGDAAMASAEARIVDPNPFLFAWLDVQRGRAHMTDAPDEASKYFQRALDRLPCYRPALVGLDSAEAAGSREAPPAVFEGSGQP